MKLTWFRKGLLPKGVALFVLVNLCVEFFAPSVAYALTSGRNQPEFSSFEPIATTDMVNTFTGDFTYNLPVIDIPGAEGGGYALSLSYHSGASMEDEASWVGFGWTLNPGAINRSLQNMPDDYKNAKVIRYNQGKPNWTASVNASLGIETFGYDAGSLGRTISFNNYKGFSVENNIGLTSPEAFKALGLSDEVGIKFENGQLKLSVDWNPLQAIAEKLLAKASKATTEMTSKTYSLGRLGPVQFQFHASRAFNLNATMGAVFESVASDFGFSPRNEVRKATGTFPYHALGVNWTKNTEINPNIPVGFELGFNGRFSGRAGVPRLGYNAYGYMNNRSGAELDVEEANECKLDDIDVIDHFRSQFAPNYFISDFHVEKDNGYQRRDHFIGIPFSDPDLFMTSGEGLGGAFRLFHNKAGHYYDNRIHNSMMIRQIGGELMVGANIGVGLDIGLGYNVSCVRDWDKKGNTRDEAVQWDPNNDPFFRFNSDLGGNVSFSSSTGVSSATLEKETPIPGFKSFSPEIAEDIYFGINEPEQGDDVELGRSGYIAYHLNSEIDSDTKIAQSAYNKDLFSMEQTQKMRTTLPDGIGEMAVTTEEGTQYVYGLPTYAKSDLDLSVGINSTGSIVDNFTAYQNVPFLNIPDGVIADIPNNIAGENLSTFVGAGEEPLAGVIPNYVQNKVVSDGKLFYCNGEKKITPYATNYLITQILTKDYVDLSNDGPSEDDFGGWTNFRYSKVSGEDAEIGSFMNALDAISNGNLSIPTEVDNWYNYRTPYNGLRYSKNSIADTEDDLGSFSKGKKEQYYLKEIETKTHIAYFVTNFTLPTDFEHFKDYVLNGDSPEGILGGVHLIGSQEFRKDAFGAHGTGLTNIQNPFDNVLSEAHSNTPSKPVNIFSSARRLEKIVLFSKSDLTKPIKTVRFDYSYSLAKGTPNNIHTQGLNGLFPANYNTSGRLTLNRVWFEYNGESEVRTSPYDFQYAYKEQVPGSSNDPYTIVSNLYPGIQDYQNIPELLQNPNYNAAAVDIWGNLEYRGPQRRDSLNPWLWQGDISTVSTSSTDPAQFDPGAWQLKQIVLPSGGEIHVQYEQKDYRYVQDRKAMGMVSLIAHTDGDKGSSGNQDDYTNNRYYLNLNDMGVSAPSQELVDWFRNYFIEGERKVYFKFLYALTDSLPSFDNCHSEFITGYCDVADIQWDQDGIGTDGIYFQLGQVDTDPKAKVTSLVDPPVVPRYYCYDYVLTSRQGFLDNTTCTPPHPNEVDALDRMFYHDVPWVTFPVKSQKDKIKDMLIELGENEFIDYSAPNIESVCLTADPTLSYLKVPLPKAKRGGGVRVKRLMVYDQGLDTGTPQLFGSEYLYETSDGLSSGVATNEPATGREESALTEFIPRLKQSFISKAIHGRDKDLLEGPVGSTVLAPPSVGHSRVVVRDLHKGVTNRGFQVVEYHTAKEFPYDKYYNSDDVQGKGVEWSTLGSLNPFENDFKANPHRGRDRLAIPIGPFSYAIDKEYATQGFRFIRNDMHGKVKSQSIYAGKYQTDQEKAINGTKSVLTASTEFDYYNTGEKIPVLSWDTQANDLKWEMDLPGKEMEITQEAKSLFEMTVDANLEIDLSISLMIWPPIFVTLAPSLGYLEEEMAVHRTSKVVSYPAILKSQRTYRDGAWAETNYIGFDKFTGTPVLTQEFDSYHGQFLNGKTHDGSVYSLNIPASWVYEGMGQKALATTPEHAVNRLREVAGVIKTYGAGGNPIASSNWKERVTAASAQTFEKNWDYSRVQEEYGATPYLSSLQKKWHRKARYIYNIPVTSGNDGGKVTNAGIFQDFQVFDWTTAASNPNWDLADMVTLYSPNGEPLEEKNIAGIYSAVRFSPNFDYQLPAILASNATYESIYFEDFETDVHLPSGLNTKPAHSGRGSLNFSQQQTNGTGALISNVKLDQALVNRGAVLKFWVAPKETVDLGETLMEVSVGGKSYLLEKIAQVGEWTLVKGTIKDWGGATVGDQVTIFATFDPTVAADLYIDDLRMQPKAAQGICYVFDYKSLRLLTQFDDQHFGTFYQYDAQGNLVRKVVETIEGRQTVVEKHTNMATRP